MNRRRRQSESGFILLFILVLAAGIAIGLLMQLPRFAFETQREREQLLIDRGEQYQRAIALYYRKYKHYPAKMEDLEDTDNIRYLRRRYIDPMTGKDDWRIVHVNGAGVLTDSLVKPLPKPGSDKNGGNQLTGINNPGNTNGNDQDAGNPDNPPQVNQAVLHRPSDHPVGTPGAVAGGLNPAYPQPGTPPGDDTGSNQTGQPGQPGEATQTGQPGAPGQPATPGQPAQTATPGQPYNPMQGMPGVINPTTGTINQPGLPQQPGAVPPDAAAGQNPALQMINNALRSPRAMPTPASPFTNGTTGGGGLFIAGVATPYKSPSIKIYNKQDKYQDWEFIYDVKSDPVMNPQLPTGAPAGGPTGNATSNPGNSTGATTATQSSTGK
jgi:type II secretory pathway pseudopilin PulG